MALVGMMVFAWLSRPAAPMKAPAPVSQPEDVEDVAPYG